MLIKQYRADSSLSLLLVPERTSATCTSTAYRASVVFTDI